MTSEQDTGNGARLPPTGPWNTLEAAAVLADYTGPLYGGMMLPPEVARYWQEIIAYCEMTGRNWMTDLLSYQELLDYAQWRGLTPDLFRLADPDPGEPDRPEQGAAGTQNPASNRQCVADKARFLDLATWEGTQQATVNQHPEATYFKGKYDAPALLKWAREIDPRPKNQRGGRPRKS